MPIKNCNMIPRKNMMRLLDGLSDERIIYVCAPAGYGKTVSVRQWLECRNDSGFSGGLDSQAVTKHAFVSLDEYDNEPPRFCARFCAALQLCQPGNAAFYRIVTHPAFDSAPDEFTIRALDALTDTEHACLVLDDLHLIHDNWVLRLLHVLLRRLPENFQIVLISRNELPPGLSDLWLKGSLSRINAKDLCFSQEEIMMLYEKRGFLIAQGQAEEIQRVTGGWAIGINAALLSGGEPSEKDFKYLEEFVEANVWQRWDEETREFMLKTSVMREMTPELCDSLTGIGNSKEMLERLVNQNAFISRNERGIYQYHHLFHAFLRNTVERRGEEYSRALLEKAGYCYLSNRDFYNAIECFMRCENHDGVANCFMLLVDIGHQEFIIDKLLLIIDTSMINAAAEKYPYIYSLLSWAAFNRGRAEDMAYYSDRYYKHHNSLVRADPRLTLNVTFVALTDFRNTLHESLPSLEELPALIAERNEVLNIKAGTINQNMPLFHRGTRDLSEYAPESGELELVKIKGLLRSVFGEVSGLLIECAAAGLLYEQGRLEQAHSHALAAVAEIKDDFSPESKFFAVSILFYVLDALDAQAQADQALDRIAEMIDCDGAYYLNYNFSAMQARRKLADGDTEAARGWLREYGTPPGNGLDFYRLYGHITTCSAYITNGNYDNAIILLIKVLELAQSYNRPLDIIESRILLSIAYWKKKRGFQAEAMRYLEEAASMAHAYGYTQIFVSKGADLAGMLRRLQKRAEQPGGAETVPASFVKMLYLQTLETNKSGMTGGQPVKPAKYTDKQRMIMRLLCEGKSYRGIAEVMGIKLSTLRSHISLIYKKLEVTSETDAVIKIKASGLLEEHIIYD